MRSGLDLAPQAKWRLKKTLSRKTNFRPIEREDIRYAWVAYKAGDFEEIPRGLSAGEFKAQFEELILTRYDAAWTLFAETRNGFIPVGFMLGFWPHPLISEFMIANAFVWFPWASPRNRIESAVGFLSAIRHDIAMVGFARMKDRKFCDVLAKHGLMSRVGTSHNVFKGERAAVWETRNGRSAEG